MSDPKYLEIQQKLQHINISFDIENFEILLNYRKKLYVPNVNGLK